MVEGGRAPVGVLLRGAEISAKGARRALKLLFSAVAEVSPELPPTLHAVRVVELEPHAPLAAANETARALRRFRIDAREGQYMLLAHGVQQHTDPSAAFFAALPRTRVTWVRRCGWTLLLALLRLLPVRRLLRSRRA